MMRAGMIKRLGAGIYTYMPMGLRVIRKVEAIVREEMNRAGAQLLDHAGAHHQPVAGDFGVGRCFLQGGNQELRSSHGTGKEGGKTEPFQHALPPCIMNSVQRFEV